MIEMRPPFAHWLKRVPAVAPLAVVCALSLSLMSHPVRADDDGGGHHSDSHDGSSSGEHESGSDGGSHSGSSGGSSSGSSNGSSGSSGSSSSSQASGNSGKSGSATQSDGDGDHELARKKLLGRQIKSLKDLMKNGSTQTQGTMIGIDLNKSGSRDIYVLKFLGSDGSITTVKIDARTGELL